MMAQWDMKDEAIVDDPIYRMPVSFNNSRLVMVKETTASIGRCSKPPWFETKGWPKRLVQRLNRIRSWELIPWLGRW